MAAPMISFNRSNRHAVFTNSRLLSNAVTAGSSVFPGRFSGLVKYTKSFRYFSSMNLNDLKAYSSTSLSPSSAANVIDVINSEAEIVRRVKSHLLEVDSSKNGQIDAETLKTILRKVGGFSDKEVLELGELFYAARGGASATHEDFLRGVAQVIREKDKIGTPYVDEKVASEESNAVVHRRVQKTNHPLGLGSCSTEYMFGKQRGVYSDEVRMIAT
jgi:hypothetical protein